MGNGTVSNIQNSNKDSLLGGNWKTPFGPSTSTPSYMDKQYAPKTNTTNFGYPNGTQPYQPNPALFGTGARIPQPSTQPLQSAQWITPTNTGGNAPRIGQPYSSMYSPTGGVAGQFGGINYPNNSPSNALINGFGGTGNGLVPWGGSGAFGIPNGMFGGKH